MSVVYREGHQELTFRMNFQDVDYADVQSGFFKLKRPNGVIEEISGTIEDNNGKATVVAAIGNENLPLGLGKYRVIGVLVFQTSQYKGKSQSSINFEIRDEFYS